MRIHLSALGCRLNEAELEQWAAAFTRAGDRLALSAETADVIVLNTCAVTAEAVRKSRQRLGRLRRGNPRAKLVISGCYSALESADTLAELGVDLVVGNQDKDHLVALTREAFALPEMPQSASEPGEAALFQRNRQRAFIKIQDGCRYRCTFCIVTVARGAERSRPIGEIVAEARRLHAEGIQEIVLTGVHVGGYGSDLDTGLAALVRALLDDTDLPRIRFASVEPWDLTDDFLALFDDPRLMPHMHLPLQSGCDTVLRRMSRRCRTADFAALTDRLQTGIPGFNVTTDIIVGFPGESEAEWRSGVDFLATRRFGHMHIFGYSRRDGTKAATLPDPVPAATRTARSRELHALAATQREAVMRDAVGARVPVLWESAAPDGHGGFRHVGYTPNYLRVSTVADRDLSNRIVPTRLDGIADDMLCGSIDPDT